MPDHEVDMANSQAERIFELEGQLEEMQSAVRAAINNQTWLLARLTELKKALQYYERCRHGIPECICSYVACTCLRQIREPEGLARNVVKPPDSLL